MVTRTPLSVNVYTSIACLFHLDTNCSVVVTLHDFSNTVHSCSRQDMVAFKLTWERPCCVTPSFIACLFGCFVSSSSSSSSRCVRSSSPLPFTSLLMYPSLVSKLFTKINSHTLEFIWCGYETPRSIQYG
jgi:hypothetical protein